MSGFGTLTKATTALFTGKKKDGEEDVVQVSGDTLSTDGIDLTVEPLPLSEAAMAMASSKERVKPKVPLSFSIWDFGGTLCGSFEWQGFSLVLTMSCHPCMSCKVGFWMISYECIGLMAVRTQCVMVEEQDRVCRSLREVWRFLRKLTSFSLVVKDPDLRVWLLLFFP